MGTQLTACASGFLIKWRFQDMLFCQSTWLKQIQHVLVKQGHMILIKKNPWNAPGTTPVFSSCGILRGHCGNDHDGHRNFGDCCSDHCDSFANGKNAEEHNWHNPAVTEWKAGSTQEFFL